MYMYLDIYINYVDNKDSVYYNVRAEYILVITVYSIAKLCNMYTVTRILK